jgi:transcriptional regulator with XRE-family HTH domain
MDKEIFAQRLKSQRELRGLTQKELATTIHISERGYQHYESASDFKPPTSAVLFAIAETLAISIDYLFGRTTNPKVNK